MNLVVDEEPDQRGAAELLSHVQDRLARLESDAIGSRRHADEQCSRIAALEEDIRVLRGVVMQERQIDLVRLGPFLIYMLCNDMAYLNVGEAGRSKTLFDLEQHKVEFEPRDVDAFLEEWRPGGDILQILVAAFGRFCGKTDFLDVGCQYGSLSMSMALFVKSLGVDVNLYAFDCGVTRHLAEVNFANNGFADTIKFYPYAVGSFQGFITVHRDVQHSEGNRIGGAISTWARGSTDEVVRCLTLDSVIEQSQDARPVVIKIDTEGAEPAVLRGAAGLLSRRPCALLMEFTPSGFGRAMGVISAAEFLSDLQDEFRIYDAGRDHAGMVELKPNDLANFVTRVQEHQSGWTDLVLLDRQSDVCRWLSERFSVDQAC